MKGVRKKKERKRERKRYYRYQTLRIILLTNSPGRSVMILINTFMKVKVKIYQDRQVEKWLCYKKV